MGMYLMPLGITFLAIGFSELDYIVKPLGKSTKDVVG